MVQSCSGSGKICTSGVLFLAPGIFDPLSCVSLMAYRGGLHRAVSYLQKRAPLPSEREFEHWHCPLPAGPGNHEPTWIYTSELAGLRGPAPSGLTYLKVPPPAAGKTKLILLPDATFPPALGLLQMDTSSGAMSLHCLARMSYSADASWRYLIGHRCPWGQRIAETSPPQPVLEAGSKAVQDWMLPPMLALGYLYLLDRRWARIYHHALTADPRGPLLSEDSLKPEAETFATKGGQTRTHPLAREDAGCWFTLSSAALIAQLEALDQHYKGADGFELQDGSRVAVIGDWLVEAKV